MKPTKHAEKKEDATELFRHGGGISMLIGSPQPVGSVRETPQHAVDYARFGSLLIRLDILYYLVIATSETRMPNGRVRFADPGDPQKGC